MPVAYLFSSLFSSAGFPSDSTLSSPASRSARILIADSFSALAALAAAARIRVGPPGERDGLLQDGILTVDHDLNRVARLVRLDHGEHFFRIGDRLAVH